MITFEEMHDAVRAEIDIEGDAYVYKTEGGACTYAEEGSPSCLIGRALNRLGVSIETLQYFDSKADSAIDTLADNGHVNMDQKAINFATEVQQWQDVHFSWGQAYKKGLDAAAYGVVH